MKIKILHLTSLIFIGLLVGFSLVEVSAQYRQDKKNDNLRQPQLLQMLGLNDDQIQRIQQIRRQRRAQIREAQMSLREANRNLDQAIYADNSDEAEIQNRLRDVQTAQAEVVKLKSLTEFEVRKVLNLEQLNKFRQLRRQSLEQMNDEAEENQKPGKMQNSLSPKSDKQQQRQRRRMQRRNNRNL